MDNKYLLFENYITNNLSKEEHLYFEKELANNTSLQEDFIAYKNTSLFLKNKFKNEETRNKFKTNLNAISSNYFNKTQKKTIHFWKYGAVASVLLLVGLFLLNNKTPNYNEVVNYNTIELVERGSQNELLLKAENAYNSKNFKEAVLYFNKLLHKTPNNSEIQLYKGFSLIELNKFKEAEKTLQIIAEGNSVFKDKAIWYLALSKLKQKEYSSCIKFLKLISKSSNQYTKAQKLINKLD